MPKVKPFDPYLAFVNARATHLASFAVEKYVQEHPALKHIMLWPELANEALGLELHLKCLHAVRGRFPEGHGIRTLYVALDETDQTDIEARLEKLISLNPHYENIQRRGTQVDIDSILSRADDMFNKARYWHEGDLPGRDSRGHVGDAGMAPLSDAIFDLLMALHPEWWEQLKTFRPPGLTLDEPST